MFTILHRNLPNNLFHTTNIRFFFHAGLNRWTPSQHLHSTARRYGTKQGAHQKKSYEFWWFILDQLRFKPQFAPTAPAQCPKNLNYIKFATTELQAALGYPVGLCFRNGLQRQKTASKMALWWWKWILHRILKILNGEWISYNGLPPLHQTTSKFLTLLK